MNNFNIQRKKIQRQNPLSY